MDEYKHCLNCLLSRSKMLDITIQIFPEDKKELNKHYAKLVQWFKDTYELKRKPIKHNSSFIQDCLEDEARKLQRDSKKILEEASKLGY